MKTAKLTIGLVSVFLAIVLIFRSYDAGLGASLTHTLNETSGRYGIFVALLMIVGGIVGIATRRSKVGAIATTIIYVICGITGLALTGMFKDLLVWGMILLIFAIIFCVSIFKQNYEKKMLYNNRNQN